MAQRLDHFRKLRESHWLEHVASHVQVVSFKSIALLVRSSQHRN